MTEIETPAYIRHRLQICGRDTPLFTDNASTLIHQVSRGYPRTINNICREAPLHGGGVDRGPDRGRSRTVTR